MNPSSFIVPGYERNKAKTDNVPIKPPVDIKTESLGARFFAALKAEEDLKRSTGKG